jgi:hypothetical protein
LQGQGDGSYNTDRGYRGIPSIFDTILPVGGNVNHRIKRLSSKVSSSTARIDDASNEISTATAVDTSIITTTVEYKHLQQNRIRPFTRIYKKLYTREKRRCTQSAILHSNFTTVAAVIKRVFGEIIFNLRMFIK